MNETTLDELILSYSAGRLPSALRFLMNVHFDLSNESSTLLGACDRVGASLFENLPTSPVETHLKARVWAAIDEGFGGDNTSPSVNFTADSDLPLCLRKRIGRPVDKLPWRQFSGIAEHELIACDEDGYCTKILRIDAGTAIPQHTHRGDELTLVLRGAFDDGDARYERGDLTIANENTDHRPVADPNQGCLCLAVTNGPIHLTGPWARFLNPFLRL